MVKAHQHSLQKRILIVKRDQLVKALMNLTHYQAFHSLLPWMVAFVPERSNPTARIVWWGLDEVYADEIVISPDNFLDYSATSESFLWGDEQQIRIINNIHKDEEIPDTILELHRSATYTQITNNLKSCLQVTTMNGQSIEFQIFYI